MRKLSEWSVFVVIAVVGGALGALWSSEVLNDAAAAPATPSLERILNDVGFGVSRPSPPIQMTQSEHDELILAIKDEVDAARMPNGTLLGVPIQIIP